jgi:hypothetical protein
LQPNCAIYREFLILLQQLLILKNKIKKSKIVAQITDEKMQDNNNNSNNSSTKNSESHVKMILEEDVIYEESLLQPKLSVENHTENILENETELEKSRSSLRKNSDIDLKTTSQNNLKLNTSFEQSRGEEADEINANFIDLNSLSRKSSRVLTNVNDSHNNEKI